MATLPAAAPDPDWESLPAGVLQRIFRLSSTWQIPGSCLASPVCHAWRAAAAGCSGIRLLYHAHSFTANQLLASWLGRNSPQLESFILSSRRKADVNTILDALADAAAAAAAAGTPLQLHTLRVLGHGPNLPLAGRLVSELPHLRHLQFHIEGQQVSSTSKVLKACELLRTHLAPLQCATQLEELHLGGPSTEDDQAAAVGACLPVTLKRLSLNAVSAREPGVPDLQQLTQLTFLQLSGWNCADLSSKLPSGLQQLDVEVCDMPPEEVEQQQQVITGLGLRHAYISAPVQHLTCCSSLRCVDVDGFQLEMPGYQTALAQCATLSALRVSYNGFGADAQAFTQQASATAASARSVRRLTLNVMGPGLPSTLCVSGLTQLRRLALTGWAAHRADAAQRVAWAEALEQLQGLRWLSVPDVLLEGGWGWVGGLRQLRVLVVCKRLMEAGADHTSTPWLEACSPQALPPHLLLLGVSSLGAYPAVLCQVRSRLRQALGSSGCELVVGPDLDDVCDPAQQLAGLPVVLQQALELV